MKFKKGICLISLLLMCGCIDQVVTTDKKQKETMVKSWIINEQVDTKKEIEKRMKYLEDKKESQSSRTKKLATKELNEWKSIISRVKNEKEKERRAKIEQEEREKREKKNRAEREDKAKKDRFFEEFCYLWVRDNLRDPESYRLDYVSYEKSGGFYTIRHSFRAKNGFGGYEKEYQRYEIYFSEDDFDMPTELVVFEKKLKRY